MGSDLTIDDYSEPAKCKHVFIAGMAFQTHVNIFCSVPVNFGWPHL
jgi:hypothetical protein